MKKLIQSNIWSVLVLSVIMLSTYSCKDEAKTTGTSFNDAVQQQTTPAATTTQTSPFNDGTPTADVDHYTCPAGHPGAASAGTCSTCGATLVHNAAFHNKPDATPMPTANSTNNSPVINPIATPPVTPPTGAATNAKGVYHYTCSAGHPGGAAGAGNCSTCGAALVHNAEFHK